MADNDVTIVVDAQNRTAAAFGEATKGAKTVGDAAAIASRQVKDMGDKLDAAQERARKLAAAEERAAERARRMAQDLALLRHELAQNGDESGTLARKIDRLAVDTRFAAEATDEYRRSANKAAADAREQARAYDRVADNARQAARAVAMLGAAATLSPNGKGGALSAGGGLLSGISAGFLKGGFGGATSALEGTLGTPVVGPALLAAGAAAAIPAASFLGGAAGGGVLAGLGAGGAGLGLAGAWAGNPDKFSGEWTASIDKVKKRWLDSSAAFGNELDGALKTADQTLERLPVEKVLALSQGFVAPLATGAGQGLAGAAAGFADALEKVQPVIDELGPKLGNLGHDVGDAFRMISEGSEGGAHALGDLIDLIGGAIKFAGLLVLGFENAYESMRDFASGTQDAIRGFPVLGVAYEGLKGSLFGVAETSTVVARRLGDAGDAAHDTAFDWGEMGEAAAEAAVNAIGLNDALSDLRNTQLASANASLAVAQGWLDLSEGLKDGARSLDMTSQAGIDNNKVIIDQIGLLERQREQAIETGGRTEDAIAAANAAYDAQIEKLRQAAYAAGFNHDKVDQLIDSLDAVPQDVNSNVQVSGLPTALAQGVSLGNALNNIDGRHYYATVDVSYQGYNPGTALGNLLHHAAGGPTSSGWSAVNDWGSAGVGEVMRLPNGSTVIPAGTGRQMMRDLATSGSGGRSGGGTATELRVTGSGALYEALMAAQLSGELQIFSQAIVD